MSRSGGEGNSERRPIVGSAETPMAPQNAELTLVERVERALVLLAYFIELDGDVHIPMYERLEAELAELKRREDTRSRARRLIAGYGAMRTDQALLAGARPSPRAPEFSREEVPSRDR